MSSDIWMQCAHGSDPTRPMDFTAWRVVEDYNDIATRGLVDSADDHDLLEALLDKSKPVVPVDARHLHYLLSTPFRYPPLRYGSRYGPVYERGLWYGATTLETSFAEVAYYRMRFLNDTTATLSPLHTELTGFSAHIETEHGADLTSSPFDTVQTQLADPLSYRASQALGSDLRAHGIHAVLVPCARYPGTNVVVFSPSAFGTHQPLDVQHWATVITPELVEVRNRSVFTRERFIFQRETFVVDGVLPEPTA